MPNGLFKNMFLQKNEKGIIGLVTIFVIGFLGLGMMLTISKITLSEIHKNRNETFGNQSFYTAETAVKEGIYQYVKNSSSSGNFALPINNIPTGSITFLTNSSPHGWAYREVEGNANNSLTNRKIKNTILLSESWAAFDYAVYSDGELTIKGGAGNSITGNVFSNNNINCNGNPTINGDIFSADSISGCNGTSVNPGAETIPPPDIDPYYYQPLAVCSSDADNVKNDCLNAPPTFGVIFAEDNPSKQIKLQNIDLTGNLTVIDNLWISGNTVITASDSDPEIDYPAIVVQGNLKVTGDNVINGLIYVTGKTNFGSGNTTINGSIISKGGTETDIAGSVTINYNSLSGSPGGMNPPTDPKIISWSEQ